MSVETLTKPLRIGIIGSGNRGINCFGRLLGQRDDAFVAAVADTNPMRMEGAARQLKTDFKRYTDLRDMVAQEELDGVVVTTPDFCHADHVIAAMEAGARRVL